MRSTDLGIAGTRFTINGIPTFLLGISYYAGLGAPQEYILADLDKIKSYSFNWIRVWATWAAFNNDVSAVNMEGNPREPFLSKLRWIIEECDKLGIVVDVTLSRGNGVTGPERLQALEFHINAVQTIVENIKDYKNWYIDLANERNIKDARFVSMEELKILRDEVKRLDTQRLVTASYAGELDYDEIYRYLTVSLIDFLTPHRPRNPESPGQTAEWTRQYLEWMNKVGKIIPVHYQEPFRRGFTKNWEPTAENFLTDLEQAIRGEAGGWCFHNGDQRNDPYGRPRRSFDLRDGSLFEQLDSEEKAFLNQLLGIVEGLHKIYK